jgi:hypothetical protein
VFRIPSNRIENVHDFFALHLLLQPVDDCSLDALLLLLVALACYCKLLLFSSCFKELTFSYVSVCCCVLNLAVDS